MIEDMLNRGNWNLSFLQSAKFADIWHIFCSAVDEVEDCSAYQVRSMIMVKKSPVIFPTRLATEIDFATFNSRR